MKLVGSSAGLPSPDVGSLPDSGYSENETSSMDLPRSTQSNAVPIAAREAPHVQPRRARHQEISVEFGLANEAFTNVKIQQKEQFERVAMFECSQHKALAVHQQHSFKRLIAQHEASRSERTEQVRFGGQNASFQSTHYR